jgi:hypothetical protein
VPPRVPLHWLLFVIAILLTVASVYFSLYGPHGPDSDRGLQLVLTANAVAWILWGQMVHANKRAARADADEYLRLITRNEPAPFRRRPRTR